MNAVRGAWEAFQSGGDPAPGRVRPAILESWRRSRARAVPPDLRAGPWAGDPAATARDGADRLFAAAAGGVLRRLAGDLAGTGCVVALADRGGIVLERAGDRDLLRRTDAAHMLPGAGWAEEVAGTNGIGLALALGGPAQVLAAEHFCGPWHAWSCSSAPVRHPVTGDVLGTLTIITPARRHEPGMVGALVRRAAWEAQQVLTAELAAPGTRSAGARLRELEREAISAALEAAGGNVTAAAAELGISRATLYRRLRTYKVLGGRL